MRVVGQGIKRVDARCKVTGQAVYGSDIRFPGMLHAKVLRSPYAHARIRSIDTSAARALPGVRVVLTGEDFPAFRGGEAIRDTPILAVGKVRYHSEAVAAVAADDLRTAERAIELIRVEYEELPIVLDAADAIHPNAPLVHPEMSSYWHISAVEPIEGTNICNHKRMVKGDIEKGFAESDLIFENEYRVPMVQHVTIETHSAVARVDTDGKAEVWTPCDGPHRLRKDLADAFNVPLTKIRVHSTYIGGGYGSKGGLKMEPLAIALAMKANHRPVSVVCDRHEDISAVLSRNGIIVRIKTGMKKDGSIHARSMEILWQTGAYAEKGPTVCAQGTASGPGPYNIPHCVLDASCIYTNQVPAGAYRGYGTNQVAWAYETHMDEIAYEMGIDPVEIRRKNLLRPGDRMPTGDEEATSCGIRECLEKALDAAGETVSKQDGWLRGRGISTIYKNTKTPSGSATYISLNQDGTVNIITSSVEIGQGVHTILAQIVSEETGVPVEKIDCTMPDTDTTPYDASTTSSRTTFHMGNAVKLAAEDLAEQIRTIAAELMGIHDDAIALDEGGAYNVDDPKQRISLPGMMAKHTGAGGTLLGKGFYYPFTKDGAMWSQSSIFWMYGAQVVDVAVDPATGKVRVEKMVCAHDVGRAINVRNCEEQIIGGAVMGLGTALYEELRFDDKGRVRNANLHDYQVPTAMDVGIMLPIVVEAEHPLGPYGAKGIGEPVVTPSAPAIGNAIFNATGVRLRSMPLSCEKLFFAMKEHNRKGEENVV